MLEPIHMGVQEIIGRGGDLFTSMGMSSNMSLYSDTLLLLGAVVLSAR